jgi:hypothetical protein
MAEKPLTAVVHGAYFHVSMHAVVDLVKAMA